VSEHKKGTTHGQEREAQGGEANLRNVLQGDRNPVGSRPGLQRCGGNDGPREAPA